MHALYRKVGEKSFLYYCAVESFTWLLNSHKCSENDTKIKTKIYQTHTPVYKTSSLSQPLVLLTAVLSGVLLTAVRSGVLLTAVLSGVL